MTEFIKVLVNVKGRVQGVFYRHNARQQASSLQLCGWVSNLPDGSVAVEAKGSKKQVFALLQWLKQGPPAANVTGVEILLQEDIEPIDCQNGQFEIRP